MRICTHVAVSLDGFVAAADGRPTWATVPEPPPVPHGFGELMAGCDAVVMGRTTFDQGFGGGWPQGWPWGDLPVYVLTAHPLPEDARGTAHVANGGPAGVVEQVRDAGAERDVFLLGGARTIQAFLDAGLVDRLGMVVLPVVLGSGIPLFASETTAFSSEAWASSQASPGQASDRPVLTLEEHHAFDDGALHLVYAPS